MFSILFFMFSIFFIIFNLYKIYIGYAYYLPSLLISVYSLFIWLATSGLLVSDFANFWSNGGVIEYSDYISIYTSIILFFYQFSVWFTELTVGKNKIDYSIFFKRFENKISKGKLIFFSLIFMILTSVYLLVVDINSIWYSKQYLFIQSVDALKFVNPLTMMLQMLIPIIGLLSIILLGLSIRLKSNISTIIILFPASFFYLLKIGDHSRFSVVYASILLIFFLVSNNKFQKFILAPFFVFMFFGNLLNSLYGRGQNRHGLIAIFDYFENINSALSSDNGGLVSNLFEGAFVHGESFRYIDHIYPLIFKILSMSPLPNFIDNYQATASIYSLRLNAYVPMGATGEILIFGLPFILFYFLIIFFSIRANILALKNEKIIIFIISLFLLILASYLQFTYPLRNIVRFFYLTIFLFYIPNFIGRLRWGSK